METNKLEKYLVPLVSALIFVVALFYPAWSSYSVVENGPGVFYGYEVFLLGWLGVIMLYVPWYSLLPALKILGNITRGTESKMRLSRVLLFLFWLEGFLGVVTFKFGGAGDAGSEQIISIGPSFWMWTILVWYILLGASFYVRLGKERAGKPSKILSVVALVAVALLAANYHIQDYRVKTFQNPLVQAIVDNETRAIEQLIQSGADLNEENGPAVTIATRVGSNPSTVSFLIQKGANINARDFSKKSALEIICSTHTSWWPLKKWGIRDTNQQAEIAKILIVAGADQESKNNALIECSTSGSLVTVGALVESGADVNYNLSNQFYSGTPLFWAVRNANVDVVKYLIEKGANVNASVNAPGGSILGQAISDSYSHSRTDVAKILEVIKILKGAGAVEKPLLEAKD